MRKLVRTGRWIVSGATLLALSSCVSSQQLMDFSRTELARVVADVFGQAFQLVTQGSA